MFVQTTYYCYQYPLLYHTYPHCIVVYIVSCRPLDCVVITMVIPWSMLSLSINYSHFIVELVIIALASRTQGFVHCYLLLFASARRTYPLERPPPVCERPPPFERERCEQPPALERPPTLPVKRLCPVERK